MAKKKHRMIVSFIEHFWPDKLLFVEGEQKERMTQVIEKLEAMRKEAGS
ncbi:MAG: hypothetical protein WC410_02415 [Candidatus Paceibacterota bacterium]|nr:hypothetical protein [Candidatus Paceibacterota bacterium]MDD5555413.1 hypothetical protein [Candidatus Paceibacterota bacterium]